VFSEDPAGTESCSALLCEGGRTRSGLPGRPPFFDADGSHGERRAHCASVGRNQAFHQPGWNAFREDGKG
jgi:hypothetical protein